MPSSMSRAAAKVISWVMLSILPSDAGMLPHGPRRPPAGFRQLAAVVVSVSWPRVTAPARPLAGASGGGSDETMFDLWAWASLIMSSWVWFFSCSDGVLALMASVAARSRLGGIVPGQPAISS